MPPPRTHTQKPGPGPGPGPGQLGRSTTTTYSLVPRTTLSTPDSNAFAYHHPSGGHEIAEAFAPVARTTLIAVAPAAQEAVGRLRATGAYGGAERSRRFLGTRLRLAGWTVDTTLCHTFLTFASANKTWGTLCNGVTLGLSAPLCRVYFVEIMLEGRVLTSDEEVRRFVEHEMGLGPGACHDGGGGGGGSSSSSSSSSSNGGSGISGLGIVRWLEYQEKNEMRHFGFYKLQGTSFSVYLISVPRWAAAGVADTETLRLRAEKRYKALDGLDNVMMLAGRFENSVAQLFRGSGQKT